MSEARIRSLSNVAIVLFVLCIPVAAMAQGVPPLGTAENFALLAYSTVTNEGTSIVTGDVGVSPGSAVTGFGPPSIINGTLHVADAVAEQAQVDLTAAYNSAAGAPCTSTLTGEDLGGRTLGPGVYCFATSAGLTGILTLDFGGDPNALFIFKFGSTLTTASASSVVLINTGDAACPSSNIFWQVGSSATLGTGSAVAGNILAQESITLTTGSSLSGRALARTGAVTLDSNTVTMCGAAVTPDIPMLDPRGLAVMMVLLLAAGLIVMRRMP